MVAYRTVSGKLDFSQPIPDENGSITPECRHYTVRLKHPDHVTPAIEALHSLDGVVEVAQFAEGGKIVDPLTIEVFTHIPHIFEETASETILETLGIHRDSEKETGCG